MKVAVTGSSGLVGSALTNELTSAGASIVRLVRSRAAAGEGRAFWDPASGEVDTDALAGVDAVVHLAGENIAGRRWSPAQKARIRDSRVDGTRGLSSALAAMDDGPRVLVCASAIGFYGDRGDEELTEESSPGTGFLPETCLAWEAACDPAREAGLRVANLRFGVILARDGGALAKMLTPFRLGVGGVLGNGRQYMSWIALDDTVGVIRHALDDDSLTGPVNTVAPRAVTNREFTKTLGSVLHRPTIFPVPAVGARIAFGEMADALLLASARVVPAGLERSGYDFRHPELDGALAHVLGKR